MPRESAATAAVPHVPIEHRVLLSIEEAAAFLGISRGTCIKLINSGELTSIHVGRRRLIARTALDAFVTGRG